MRNQAMMLLAAAMMLIAAVSFAGAAPPTTLAATQPSAQLHEWFDQLADADPAVRESARINLMGMKRDQLDQFKQLVEENRPLTPSQLAVLHDIVVQVFLVSEPYERFPGASVIGVKLADFTQTPVVGDDGVAPLPEQCVVVTRRLPGFPAFRFLKDGDLLLGILKREFIPTPDFAAFLKEVRSMTPGDAVGLRLVRQGKVMEVSFRVEAAPLEAAGLNSDPFFNARADKAEAYWNQTFARLLPAPLS